MINRLPHSDSVRFMPMKPVIVRKTLSAFTLIEMLVVMGIIVVLIAILIPVLSNSAATGRKMTCMSRQRAISQQIDEFVVNSFMRFPRQTQIGNLFEGLSVDDPEDDTPFLMPGQAIGESTDMRISYALNLEFMIRDVSMTQITNVSTTLLLYDGFIASESLGGKVAILHKPGTPAAKILYLPPSAIGGHLGHGDIVGAWIDPSGTISNTALTLDDFAPRHTVGEIVGTATFVDGHAEFRPKLDASMFIAPD